MNQETITLQLDVFEGPFELLLYLIKKNDLEISRVSLAQVTDQYLKYLDTLKELNVDLASDFLFMASELAYIKSRTLLPNEAENIEDDDDPMAADLIAKLKEYERYKMAATDLKKRSWLNRDIFCRGSFIEEGELENNEKKERAIDFFDVDSMELIKAFSEVLERLPNEKLEHHILAERISVSDRLYEILDVLKKSESVLFTDLFTGDKTRMADVVTFLAVMELTKLKMTKIYQTDTFQPIRLMRRLEISEGLLEDRDSIESVESYK